VEKYSLSNWIKEIQEKHIWELTYKEEDYDEDNDTSEEDEDDEHFDEDYMKNNSSNGKSIQVLGKKLG